MNADTGAGLQPTLVAGGTGALGTAVVGALLEDGRPVVATWLHEGERDVVQQQFAEDRALTLVHADVADPTSVEALVAQLPGLGGVVNLVGGFVAGRKVHETDPDAFEPMLRLNLRPTFLLARSAMPRLTASGGGFVAVSSRAALRPFSGAAGYITAKAALIALVHALDTEYHDAGVRCNVVVPRTIDTPANRRGEAAADHSRWDPRPRSPRWCCSCCRLGRPRSAEPPCRSMAAHKCPGRRPGRIVRYRPPHAPHRGLAHHREGELQP